jgi:cell division protein FtsI (penicillin-binding protein 3)
VGESTEPGSTFKLMSMIAALEDGVVDLDDTINTGDGTVRYYDKVIRDHEEEGLGRITAREVFEHSSNVGTANIINESYKENPRRYVDRLYSMQLNKPLGLQIKGEGKPLIRYPGEKYWSGISLPMMSHGYEVQLTPMQILTFYNAVANNGKMVKPRFVTEVRDGNRTVKSFGTEVISNAICSRSTVTKAQSLLVGVVENGTAKNLKNSNYRIAGKTGTAQIANAKHGYRSGSRISYQASFVGYFPADNPLYSCIVVVSAPSNWVYYGNVVSGPVFKEIADKVYATSFYRPLQALNPEGEDKVKLRDAAEIIRENDLTVSEGVMPDVVGMGLRDAIYLLENSGLRVYYTGQGRVSKQSPPAGARISKGATVSVELRLR